MGIPKAGDDAPYANDWAMQISPSDMEMRLQFAVDGKVICNHVLSSEEAYAFAKRILGGYDRLEGLDK